MLLKLDNYDIAFSRDNVHEASPDFALSQAASSQSQDQAQEQQEQEVVLLVVENSDLPKIHGHPKFLRLVNDQLNQSLVVVFEDQGTEFDGVECINLPEDVYQALTHFSSIWFCGLDDEQVVFEHELPLI